MSITFQDFDDSQDFDFNNIPDISTTSAPSQQLPNFSDFDATQEFDYEAIPDICSTPYVYKSTVKNQTYILLKSLGLEENVAEAAATAAAAAAAVKR